MLANFSVVPLDKGESVSKYVAKIIAIIEDSNIPHKSNPMGTCIEGTWDEVMGVVRKCHEAMLEDSNRVITQIKIDDRPGKPNRLEGKLQSIEKLLGHDIEK